MLLRILDSHSVEMLIIDRVEVGFAILIERLLPIGIIPDNFIFTWLLEISSEVVRGFFDLRLGGFRSQGFVLR